MILDERKNKKMDDRKALLGAHDLIELYGLSRVKAYQILNDKTLPVIRLGKRLFVKRDSFEKWLDEKQVGAGG